MHRLLILLTFTLGVEGGTIQGVVIEHASGRALSRTFVRLDPVPKSGGTAGQSMVTRTNQSGQFAFPTVTPGTYLLVALRTTYFPAAYGQKSPAGRPTPISVTADSKLFAEIRMRHKGSLTGRVLDENGIGAPGVPVVAYRARLPLRSVGKATSDDRGVFRIPGLDPGKYWVRSGAYTLDDGAGWLPTFAPQTGEVRDARVYQLAADADTTDTDIRPESGPLFSVSGWITCEKPGSVLVTLSSETGERSARTVCGAAPGSFQFQGIPAARYELFAASENNAVAGFNQFTVGGDTKIDISLFSLPEVEIEVRRAGSGSPADFPIRLTGHRVAFSETGNSVEIPAPRTNLPPGYWEIHAQVPTGQYVDSIVNLRTGRRREGSVELPSDWYDIFVEPRFPSRIRITVSDQVGQIRGRVTTDGTSVPGAPVFLWPVAESARRSIGGYLQLISDTEGGFVFDSLPPGDYRLLASFDVSEVEDEVIQLSGTPVVHAPALQPVVIDLPLWAAPF